MKKVLVIEDNIQVNENLCEILGLANYDVMTAPNGAIGVELAINNQPDLILCDVMMPELDGFGVLKILSNHDTASSIPLIFLTAKAENTDFRKGMGLGAVDYITKPFDDTELLQAIEVRLLKSQKSRERPILHSRYSAEEVFQELASQVQDCEIRNFHPKDMIFPANGVPRYLYYIEEGVVRTYMTNDSGKELTLEIYGSQSFFGSSAIVSETVYGQSAMTMTDCVVKLLPRSAFETMMNHNPAYAVYFQQQMSERIGYLSSDRLESAYSSVRRKVAVALLKYGSAIHHDQLEDGSVIAISREDLSTIAGSAKETTIRTLGDFKSEGLINIDNHDII